MSNAISGPSSSVSSSSPGPQAQSFVAPKPVILEPSVERRQVVKKGCEIDKELKLQIQLLFQAVCNLCSDIPIDYFDERMDAAIKSLPRKFELADIDSMIRSELLVFCVMTSDANFRAIQLNLPIVADSYKRFKLIPEEVISWSKLFRQARALKSEGDQVKNLQGLLVQLVEKGYMRESITLLDRFLEKQKLSSQDGSAVLLQSCAALTKKRPQASDQDIARASEIAALLQEARDRGEAANLLKKALDERKVKDLKPLFVFASHAGDNLLFQALLESVGSRRDVGDEEEIRFIAQHIANPEDQAALYDVSCSLLIRDGNLDKAFQIALSIQHPAKKNNAIYRVAQASIYAQRFPLEKS